MTGADATQRASGVLPHLSTKVEPGPQLRTPAVRVRTSETRGTGRLGGPRRGTSKAGEGGAHRAWDPSGTAEAATFTEEGRVGCGR